MAKIVLDLHDIYNKGTTIDAELNRVIAEAIEKKITLVEIIPGKGSGQLKKHVLRFLAKPEIKGLYHRIKKDEKNYGKVVDLLLPYYDKQYSFGIKQRSDSSIYSVDLTQLSESERIRTLSQVRQKLESGKL